MNRAIYLGDENNQFLGTISIDFENRLIIEISDVAKEMEIIDILSQFAADDVLTQPFGRSEKKNPASLYKIVRDDYSDLEELAVTLRVKGFRAIIKETH